MSFLISLVDISFSYISSELSRFSHTETSPDPYQTFNIELLRKQLTAYAVSYFRNNAPGLMFDMVLNTFLATVMQKSCYGNFRKLRRKQMQQCLFSKILQVFILSQRTFTTCFPKLLEQPVFQDTFSKFFLPLFFSPQCFANPYCLC